MSQPQPEFAIVPEVTDAPTWAVEPPVGLLWSLLDMKRFYAEKLANLASVLGTLEVMSQHELAARIPASARTEGAPVLNTALTLCEEADLPVSARLVRRIQEAVQQGITAAEFGQVVSDLALRIEDELASILFFRIPSEKSALYQGQALFGDEVAAAFPSALYDIEEAGKSLATGRSTACVFHLMRVLEIALHALCVKVGLTPGENNWQNLLDQVERASKQSQFQAEQPFYHAIVDRLKAVKEAWRNPTMHVRGKYNEEEALEAFNMVKAFMRRLPPNIAEVP